MVVSACSKFLARSLHEDFYILVEGVLVQSSKRLSVVFGNSLHVSNPVSATASGGDMSVINLKTLSNDNLKKTYSKLYIT